MPRQPEHGWLEDVPPPTLAERHAQFVRQAGWTRATRSHMVRRARLLQAERVLDVGCGTGVITRELARRTRGQVIGLDLDAEVIAFAQQQGSQVHYKEGDALALPYPDGHFDIAACHFVLMWVADPLQAVREMARVVRPGGFVLLCGEPDYGGRLDWPELPIRRWQVEGLRRQGADPLLGRRLRQLSAAAGLRADVGIIPSHWDIDALRENWEQEWMWLARDVRLWPGGSGQDEPAEIVSPAAFARARNRARAAIEEGTRLAFIPIFYAVGSK